MDKGGIRMGFLFTYWRRYWKKILVGITFLTLESFCDLIQPAMMSKIIDVGVKNKSLGYTYKMTAIMLLITLIGAFGAVIRNILSGVVSQHIGTDIRLDIFKKINSFSFNQINKFETATLITRITNDTSQLQNFTNGLMRIYIKAPIVCIGSIIMASILNIKLALVLAVVVPSVVILIFFNMKIGYPYFVKLQNTLDKTNSVIREYLSGIRVVRAFNRFNYESKRFKIVNDELTGIAIEANKIMVSFSTAMSLIVNLGIVVILWVSGSMIASGSLQVGQLMAFINYMLQILASLIMISNVYQQFIRARASAERVNSVLFSEDSFYIAKSPQKKEAITGNITFKDVSFKYEQMSGYVLKNINFSVQGSEMLGIIGSTGSGKSSMMNLIPRFYDVSDGEIILDGISLQEYDIDFLRSRIAVVPQKVQLFSGTIEENIRWGKGDASKEEVIEAAKKAQAHEFIMSFENGYKTLLGQDGVNLSGGQKQRISIARAIIRNPNILILDDCVSAVDVKTEASILDSFKNLGENLTCIMVTQRIKSVRNLKNILVLDEGMMVGFGDHEYLFNNCTVYKEIYRSQFGEAVIK